MRRREIKENLTCAVVGLEKTYKKYLWASQKDLKAVGGVSFTVEKGEIFCLLGHNGAGKTTTINMLTGLFPSTKGTAYINGIDIAEDMDAVRREMGVTPQHDILWAELSAIEHLRIFARLKGFTGAEAEREIQLRLNKMGLWDVRSHRVKTFSGGMKRYILLTAHDMHTERADSRQTTECSHRNDRRTSSDLHGRTIDRNGSREPKTHVGDDPPVEARGFHHPHHTLHGGSSEPG